MTEEQAKKKWCPMTRIFAIDNQKFGNKPRGKYETSDIGTYCIASDCMMGCDKDGYWLGYCGLTSK